MAVADGNRMSYLDEGPRSDEAVVLLHGNPTWSFFYRGLVAELSRERRCVAPDHVGMGLSDKPAVHDYSLAGRIADVESLVGRLGLKQIDLVVHDWGGAIGFGLAARRPELIGRIVVLNTAAFFLDRIPLRIAVCRIPCAGALLVRGLNAFAAGAARMAVVRPLPPEVRRAYLFPYGSWGDRVAVHRFVRDIPMEPGHPSRRTLEEISGALPRLAGNLRLIVWGGRDFCFDDRFLARWRELFPAAEAVRYPNAGHYVLEDAGADARARVRNALLGGRPG